MYYVLENDKPNFFENLFSWIKLEQNKIILPLGRIKISNKKIEKIARKTVNLISFSNSNKIVLSKEIKKKEDFLMLLQSEPIHIVDGKWLFEMLTIDVLDYLCCKMVFKKEDIGVSVLINDENDSRIQIIKELSKQYKTVNLITNHREKFKRIEEQIMEEQGVILMVTNNRKKSLARSKIVVNFDFPEELFQKYSLPEDAVVLNFSEKIEIKNKRFNGVLVQDYEISVGNWCDYDIVLDEKFDVKDLYESQFYKKQPYDMVRKQMKVDGVCVCKLFGKNGVI